ncbi:AAA family ATPase [Carnobacteriaceae bacterium zg-ZUI252]|nr:AAA family ATPase [Carnobacteriaceae bacterium zg-ZUI252]
MNNIEIKVPSSFVKRQLKLKQDRGAGEAKLFIGMMTSESDYDNFFNNFSSTNKYYFEKSNLIDYLKLMKMEYLAQKCNEYKDIDENYFDTIFENIDNCPDSISFTLEVFKDNLRYYIRPNTQTKNDFEKCTREIALPKITKIYITKNNDDFIFRLEPDWDEILKRDSQATQIVDLPNVPRQLIYFGAPGTGKSKAIEDVDMPNLLGSLADNYERVTFHPDYSYAHFVGTYKPVPKESDDSVITYKYVPGPFLRTFVKAVQSINNGNPEPYLLIIEEINRSNVAAVFGDVFQLLDRKDNVSEYPIQTSEDMRKYLAEELGGNSSDYDKIKIPDNMFIWATMNSADQGVFPMDTAFKRRWDFKYISVNDGQDIIADYTFTLGQGSNERVVNWNQLRVELNNFLIEECRVNEDKLLGPFFIKPSTLCKGNEEFKEAFKNKILMYLFDDAAKSKKQDLFRGCSNPKLFSAVLEEFDNKGVLIFDNSISDLFGGPIHATSSIENSRTTTSEE